MSSTGQVQDLSDLRTDLINRMRDAVSVTATNTITDRYLNTALHDMHLGNPVVQPWWAIRRGTLITHAPYSTGTVTITAAARTTVTGSSTLWNTAVTGMGFNNARAGGKMTFSGATDVHEVSTVTSDTVITLLSRYTGDALSAATYNYFEDEYALASDFGGFVDMRMFSTDMNIPLIGEMQFRRLFVRNSTTQRPRVACFLQKAFSGSTTPQYRVGLHPPPDDEYPIPYNYITTNLAVSTAGAEQTQLSATTDEPIMPLRFRHALVARAAALWFLYYKDDTRFQAAQAEYVEIMQRMAGALMVGQDRPRLVAQHGYGGSRRRRRGGRFDLNDDFDYLRDR